MIDDKILDHVIDREDRQGELLDFEKRLMESGKSPDELPGKIWSWGSQRWITPEQKRYWDIYKRKNKCH